MYLFLSTDVDLINEKRYMKTQMNQKMFEVYTKNYFTSTGRLIVYLWKTHTYELIILLTIAVLEMIFKVLYTMQIKLFSNISTDVLTNLKGGSDKLKEVVSGIVDKLSNRDGVKLIIAVVLFSMLNLLSYVLLMWQIDKLSLKFKKHLHRKFFQLFHLSSTESIKVGVGSVINTNNTIIEDVNKFLNSIVRVIPDFFGMMLFLGMFLIQNNPFQSGPNKPSSIIIIGFFTYIALKIFFVYLTMVYDKKQNLKKKKNNSEINNFFNDSVTNFNIIKQFSQEINEEQHLKSLYDQKKLDMKSYIIMFLGYALDALFWLIFLWDDLSVLLSTIITMIFLLVNIKNTAQHTHKIMETTKHLNGALKYYNKLKFDKTIYGWKVLEGGIEKIELKDLNFSYIKGQPVLHNLNFEIKRGDFIGIMAPSGFGKTTLINIVSKFLAPKNNMVYVNGEDINNLDKSEYLKHINIVSQQPEMLDRTIEENLIFDNGEMGPLEKYNKMNEFVKAVDLYEVIHDGSCIKNKYRYLFIINKLQHFKFDRFYSLDLSFDQQINILNKIYNDENLDNYKLPCLMNYMHKYMNSKNNVGFNNFIYSNVAGICFCFRKPIGLKGATMSGGQRQRLAIARILGKPNTSMLILDEPTSALDDKNTQKIIQLIKKLFYKKVIIIVISHGKMDYVDYVWHLK